MHEVPLGAFRRKLPRRQIFPLNRLSNFFKRRIGDKQTIPLQGIGCVRRFDGADTWTFIDD